MSGRRKRSSNKFTVYVAKLNEQIKYVGFTGSTLAKRKSNHYYDAFTKNTAYAFHRALRKYGKVSTIGEAIRNNRKIRTLNRKFFYYIGEKT